MASYVKQLAKKCHFRVEVIEIDIGYNRKADFTQKRVQHKWLQFISQGGADALLVTPPCSTFSRAHWANEEGPLPLRSFPCPRGFAWNVGHRRTKAWQGSALAMEQQLQFSDKLAAMEQPEDLGATPRPRIPGHRPASMWQWPQHGHLAALPGVTSVALAQLDFGSESAKPTRLLMRVPGDLHPEMYEGLPLLDHQGYYQGPLPRKTGAPLIGKANGVYKTAAAAEWPAPLCKWMAEKVLLSFKLHSENQGQSQDQEQDKGPRKRERAEDEERSEGGKRPRKEEETEVDPFFPLTPGGKGKSRACEWKGTEVPYHDGGCLQSPGRWDPSERIYPMGEEWKAVRKELYEMVVEKAGGEARLERECFAMAKGGQSFKLAKDEALLGKIRRRLWEFCGRPSGAFEVAEGQPFWLGLMSAVLQRAGDTDFEFLKEAEEGLPLGVKFGLPRTPQSFERQTEWALEEDPTLAHSYAKANYSSAAEHEAHLRAHLEAEVEEGLMEKVPMEEFIQRYGEDRAIAALAVLVEDEVAGKKRVIHDGTHGINVNRKIKCLDKLRMPGGREKRYLLRMFKRGRDIAFSLIGDFGKAHRRFKYRKEEHGFLGCVVKEEEKIVYINKVGTFGISSTPYWWGRISGALIRLCHALLGPDLPLEILLYADDLETMGVGPRGRRAAVLTFIYMAVFGSPFKWSKQRGGLETEWIGLMTDYGGFSYGISERRARWIVGWIHGLCKGKLVLPREFMAGLGRLGFITTALPWERPFLGPLYVWASAISGQKGKVVLPWSILIILDWIARRLESGGRMEPVTVEEAPREDAHEIFTDARASEKDACLGGFLACSKNLKECPWFSIPVDEKLAPWLFSKGGNPKRVIASLELLATLLAVKFWTKKGQGNAAVRTKAFTDNRGNAFALKRGMSTKFPLTLLIMELAEEMREKDLKLDLEWIKRDFNTDADDLSNGEWKNFDESMRIHLGPDGAEWKVLGELMKRGEDLYKEIAEFKEEKKRSKQEGLAKLAKGRKLLPKW